MIKSTENDQSRGDECPLVSRVYNDLMRRWTMPIIYSLGNKGELRFNEMKREIGNISSTSLSERLSELESLGIIRKKIFAEVPVRVEYSLSPKGWELHAILHELAQWMIKWKKGEVEIVSGRS
ncbi:MAG: helix-turn-helix transcriptional regulator [Candidatus Thermoplasmatota archaeon]|jgi:DNA-binding HxlR family transcriptional regulator|nr:helix-turn-helix transcriptional regulator [Candidatus Thermoplasmatota archaeon]MCL5785146.1 helix-turn-helix transcriptional regulator [Candidatus Thermoplasmatota archaeon]